MTSTVRSRVARTLPPTLVLLGLVGLWELAMLIFQPPRYLLPAPHEIAVTWVQNWDLMLRNGANTARASLVGFVIGASIAVVAASVTAPVRWLAGPSTAYAAMLQATPLIVLTPLINVWVGAGFTSKVTVVAIASIPVMFIATVRGLSMGDVRLERLLRSYAAGRAQTFFKIRLPAAAPSILSGAKVAITASIIIAIVAELFGGPIDSIGTYMKQEAFFFRNRNVWAAAVTAVLFGLVFYAAAGTLERLVLHWHPSRRSTRT